MGDCIDKPLRLETTAGREGTLATINALEEKREVIDYNTVPYTIFTDPELAGVGYTEERQRRETGGCYCSIVEFRDIPRARIEGREEGIATMVADRKTRKILGVNILSPRASELILPGALLVAERKKDRRGARVLTCFSQLF